MLMQQRKERLAILQNEVADILYSRDGFARNASREEIRALAKILKKLITLMEAETTT
jgi:hypothetical protein